VILILVVHEWFIASINGPPEGACIIALAADWKLGVMWEKTEVRRQNTGVFFCLLSALCGFRGGLGAHFRKHAVAPAVAEVDDEADA
jgi:hypothetical protein